MLPVNLLRCLVVQVEGVIVFFEEAYESVSVFNFFKQLKHDLYLLVGHGLRHKSFIQYVVEGFLLVLVIFHVDGRWHDQMLIIFVQ